MTPTPITPQEFGIQLGEILTGLSRAVSRGYGFHPAAIPFFAAVFNIFNRAGRRLEFLFARLIAGRLYPRKPSQAARPARARAIPTPPPNPAHFPLPPRR